MLHIKNLTVVIERKKIIENFSLEIGSGECHAIMGPNGAGKSSLAKVLAGHPSYEVVEGEVFFKGESILEKAPEERAKLGLLMSFQYPVEIPGVTNREFLYEAYKAITGRKDICKEKWACHLIQKAKEVGLKEEFLDRSINEGFSGGEKKKNEILQMAILEPALAILDETDSGLDIDSLKNVAKGINEMRNSEKSFLLITHYQRLLDYVKPDRIHVMIEGVLAHSAGPELALQLEEKGYDWITRKK